MSNTITINVVTSVSTSPTSGYFVLPGDFTSLFFPGFEFNLTNGFYQSPYTVVSSALVAGETQVVVSTPIEGSVVGFTFAPGTAPYISGVYTNVSPSLSTSVNGTGATATITVVGPGSINATGAVVPGSGYVGATYTLVPLTGGTGTGAVATINVTPGGLVQSVIITTPGTGYLPTDVLSADPANLGGSGSGFSITVVNVTTTVALQVSAVLGSPGVGYMVGDVLTFTGPFSTGSTTFTISAVSTNELGVITLANAQPMFAVGAAIYVINDLPGNCMPRFGFNNNFNPTGPQTPAVQSGTVLGSTVTYNNTSMSPIIQYSIRLINQTAATQFDESVVFVDKATAIAAYSALML